MAKFPIPPGWTEEDVQRVKDGRDTQTDVLLVQARAIKDGFSAAAQNSDGTAAVFAPAAALADLCVSIVENQRRLEREMEKMDTRWKGPLMRPVA